MITRLIRMKQDNLSNCHNLKRLSNKMILGINEEISISRMQTIFSQTHQDMEVKGRTSSSPKRLD